MTIFYWMDGCWVYDWEIAGMGYKLGEYGSLIVSEEVDEHAIDALVRDAIV